jgi:RHS repeat-associated protein
MRCIEEETTLTRKPIHRLLLAAAAALLFSVAAVAQTEWSSGTITYDGLGNITAMGQDVYVYDSAGRLVSGTANQQQSGVTARQDYSYDGYGNRLNATTTGTSCVGRCAPSVTVNTATNQLSNSGATYDGAGHLKTVGAETYTYDGAEMVSRVKDSSIDWQYVYTADEERLATYTGQGNWRFTVRDSEQKVVREFTVYQGASATTWTWDRDHVFRDGALLATLYPSGQRQQFHLDHLGSPRVVSDVNGVKVGTHAYYPFGDELDLATTESLSERLKFTGHERDSLGSNEPLDYMHARYYSPTMGRFLSVDPIIDQKRALAHPQVWNRYSYVENNPVNLTDPDGKCPLCVLIAIGFVGGMFLSSDTANAPAPGDQTVPNAGPASAIGGTMEGLSFAGAGNAVTRFITRQANQQQPPPQSNAPPANDPAIRPDVKVSGGRSGQNVKTTTGPPNSIIRGSGGRIYRTNDKGQIIADITKDRVKPVEPGGGFGQKRPPTQEELGWLDKMMNAIKDMLK